MVVKKATGKIPKTNNYVYCKIVASKRREHERNDGSDASHDKTYRAGGKAPTSASRDPQHNPVYNSTALLPLSQAMT